MKVTEVAAVAVVVVVPVKARRQLRERIAWNAGENFKLRRNSRAGGLAGG